uniref:Protein kinase domain-containing protein n=1 Tax=viral metagenome TaxID=1070528 RepID=A0A6C0AGR3_9ZZZZ
MKGGLKLRNELLLGFVPVMNMIRKGMVTLLTANSLKGFIFKLDLEDEDDSEYLGLDGNGRFTVPVMSYILKIAVITDIVQRLPPLELDKQILKESETYNSFFEETQMQQSIWENSILGGKPEICPSVANLAFFTDTYLMEQMRNRTNGDDVNIINIIDTLEYLIRLNSRTAVLTMPTVPDSKTLGAFIRKARESNPSAEIPAKISVVTKIVRLFLQGYIHLDLHTGNALVFLTDEGISSRIIDFGRIQELTPACEALHHELYSYLNPSRQTRSTASSVVLSNAQKSNIIQRVLVEIHKVDLAYNQRRNRNAHSQMRWVRSSFLDINDKRDENNLAVFEELARTNVVVSSITQETIKSYKSQGLLIHLDSIAHFLQDSALLRPPGAHPGQAAAPPAPAAAAPAAAPPAAAAVNSAEFLELLAETPTPTALTEPPEGGRRKRTRRNKRRKRSTRKR